MGEDTVKLDLMGAYHQLSPAQVLEAERKLGINDLLTQLARLVDDGHFDQLRDVLKELDPELYKQVFVVRSGSPMG